MSLPSEVATISAAVKHSKGKARAISRLRDKGAILAVHFCYVDVRFIHCLQNVAVFQSFSLLDFFFRFLSLDLNVYGVESKGRL